MTQNLKFKHSVVAKGPRAASLNVAPTQWHISPEQHWDGHLLHKTRRKKQVTVVDLLLPDFLWETRANYSIAYICSRIFKSRLFMSSIGNELLKQSTALPAGPYKYNDAPYRNIATALYELREVFRTSDGSYRNKVQESVGPWPSYTPVALPDTGATAYPIVSCGYILTAPDTLLITEPMTLVKSLHEALNEISPLGLPFGFEWEKLDIELIHMWHDAAERELLDAWARLKHPPPWAT